MTAFWGFHGYLADEIEDLLNAHSFFMSCEISRHRRPPFYAVEKGVLDKDPHVVIVPSYWTQERDEFAADTWKEEYHIEIAVIKKIAEPKFIEEYDELDKLHEEVVGVVRQFISTAPAAACVAVNKGRDWPLTDEATLLETNIYLAVSVFTFRRLDDT